MLRERSWASSMMIVSYGAQLAVRLDLGEQDAVRHQLDEGGVRSTWSVKRTFQPTASPSGVLQLLGDPLGDRAGGDPARLGVPDHAADAPAQLQADLRDLRRLAGAGLTRDDHDLVVADRLQDLVLLLADRQLLGIRDLGHPAARRGRSRASAFVDLARRSRRARPPGPRAYGSGGRLRAGGRAAARSRRRSARVRRSSRSESGRERRCRAARERSRRAGRRQADWTYVPQDLTSDKRLANHLPARTAPCAPRQSAGNLLRAAGSRDRGSEPVVAEARCPDRPWRPRPVRTAARFRLRRHRRPGGRGESGGARNRITT